MRASRFLERVEAGLAPFLPAEEEVFPLDGDDPGYRCEHDMPDEALALARSSCGRARS